ncbi:uncharacterized protein JN550_004002 [Neoarthrinium moseri]|uniref:uncharacterized protein n=1 Tax=Neoarthrinium moseri TaxID=1658444 RepID=UPI001FDC7ED6|nr:uncharacterized protein JN550_004002 [Neoarthrinium moseri]KAI1872283.1 hypothetical protein JN550_004002 [Neoarthrinium moseri]
MQFSIRAFAILLALPAAVRAVFEDEVNHIDYHHELLGVPQRETTFFHRPRPDDKASLLYTLSDLGVLGAVNPSTGSIVWRQLLQNNITSQGGHLRAAADAKWVASALGSSVQAWDALTGRNIWSLDFDGQVKDLEVMELTENGRKDTLALYQEQGATVARRIHGSEGRVVWEFRAVNDDIPLQVSTNSEKVFVVSLHGSFLSYGLKVTVLDPLTGKKLDEITIGTKGEVQKEQDVMFVGANSAAPVVAWTDNAMTKLKVNVLGTKGKTEFPLLADTRTVEIHAPHHVQSQPHFLVQSRTKTANKADVFHVDLKSNAITKAYDLPLLDGESAFSTSTAGSNVYFTRVTPDEVLIVASTSHGVLGRWPLKGADAKTEALHAVSEVVKKSEDSFAVRSAAVLDSDDWAMVRNGEVAWTRPEGLSGAIAATWAEIPESEDLAKTLDAEAHSNPIAAYIHRVNRHINDLQYLPAFLQSVPGRLLSTILGTDILGGTSTVLSRDTFGFNKLVVLATQRGKLYGLDAGNHGRIVWSKSARETPSTNPWNVKAIHADDAKGFVTIRGADGEYIIVHSDTGKTVETMGPGLWPPVESAVLVDSAAGPWLLPIGLEGKIGEVPLQFAPKQIVVVRSAINELKGVTFEPKGEQAVEIPAWIYTTKATQRIVDVATRSKHDPIASIGRVLGDRSVKYKYLNPNAIVVSAVDDAASTLTVSLLDSVSGQVLTSSTYEGVDTNQEITCAVAENWFVCTFFGEYTLRESPAQLLKGHQLVISDLYESELSDDRGPLGNSANFSSLEPIDLASSLVLPSVVSKTFVLSGPISALAVTQTRQGITTRQLLAYAPELHSIIGIPRMIIEPRRMVGRDPTPAEAEEGITRYSPAVELDSRLMITHERDIIGVQDIITAPAILESTSLVFAYGVDIFGSRVTPSMAFDVLGKGFNKVTLIGTVVALTAGVLFLGPMVRYLRFFTN